MTLLTRKQQQVLGYLLGNQDNFAYPPTLEELAMELGLASRGSLHKHLAALVAAGLVEPMGAKGKGIRLTPQALANKPKPGHKLPFLGRIAAGMPIEAVATQQFMEVPAHLKSGLPCYVLQVKGDSLVDAGILDGDWVVIEQRAQARNGEIVVALINQTEATLKIIEQAPGQVKLHPANVHYPTQAYPPEQVEIQGVLIAQMRRYG